MWVMGLLGIQSSNQALETIYRDRVLPLKYFKRVADEYAVSIVGAVDRANNGLLTAEETLKAIREARTRIRAARDAYAATYLIPEEVPSASEADRLFESADRQIDSIEQVLSESRGRLNGGSAEFLGPLYTAIDPIGRQVAELVALQLQVAETEFQKAQDNYVRMRNLGIVLLVLGLCLGALIGYRIVHGLLRQLGGEPTYTAAVANRIAGGDLSIRIALKIGDTDSLLFAMRNMVEKLSQTMTERARAEEELRRVNRELEEFAYVASHDLKAPLRAVANLALVIDEDAADQLDEGNRERLRLLRQRMVHMDTLIGGLLSYARVGTITPDMCEQVPLTPLLAELINELSFPPDFRVEVHDSLPILKANRLHLRQIFQNLITNAVEHHDRPEGAVRIVSQERARAWLIDVADDGAGIPPEARDTVFKMFSSRYGSGGDDHAGIGLAVVRKLVLRYGGTVEITDNQPRGAVLRIIWPKEEGCDL